MAKRASAKKKKRTAHRSPRHRRNLVQFFAESPLAKALIDLERKPDHGRPVDLSAASCSTPA
jgi:hypothetical protein